MLKGIRNVTMALRSVPVVFLSAIGLLYMEVDQIADAGCLVKCVEVEIEQTPPVQADQFGEFEWDFDLFSGSNDDADCDGTNTYWQGNPNYGTSTNVGSIAISPSSGQYISGGGERVDYHVTGDLQDTGQDGVCGVQVYTQDPFQNEMTQQVSMDVDKP